VEAFARKKTWEMGNVVEVSRRTKKKQGLVIINKGGRKRSEGKNPRTVRPNVKHERALRTELSQRDGQLVDSQDSRGGDQGLEVKMW